MSAKQPHLRGHVANVPASVARQPEPGVIERVYVSRENDRDVVVVDVILTRTHQMIHKIPVMSASARQAETPRKGDFCMVGYAQGSNFSAFVMGFFPGIQSKDQVESPSWMNERREFAPATDLSVDYIKKDGSQSIRRLNFLEIIVTGDSDADDNG